jgi:hypothetical protein
MLAWKLGKSQPIFRKQFAKIGLPEVHVGPEDKESQNKKKQNLNV